MIHPAKSSDFTEIPSPEKGYNTLFQSEILEPRRHLAAQIVEPAHREGFDDINVTIKRFVSGKTGENFGTAKRLNPDLRTWVVIHGRSSSASSDYIQELADAIDGYQAGDQVVTVNWRAGADNSDDLDFRGEDWIKPVARATKRAFKAGEFPLRKLNFVGHSWGAYVAAEFSEIAVHGVNTIVALDPPQDVKEEDKREISGISVTLEGGKYNPDAKEEIRFKRDSKYAWAFRADKTEIAEFLGIEIEEYLGSLRTPQTADEAFFVGDSDHYTIVDFLSRTIRDTYDPGSNKVADRFRLQRLLNYNPGPWKPNQYDPEGKQPNDGYEGILFLNNNARPITLIYIDADTGDEVE